LSDIKLRKPETHGEARAHDRYTREAQKQGTCIACSAQYAYGRQLGFANINSPCKRCLPIVQTWPIVALNGWRKYPGRATAADPVTTSADSDSSGTTVALVDTHEAPAAAEVAA